MSDICPCIITKVISVIQPDTVMLFKRITCSPTNWFIYGFQNFKYESVRGFIVHKYHNQFPDDVIVKAFDKMMDDFTNTSFEILETL